MAGETAKYTPFSKTNNVCVIFHAKDGIDAHEHETAGRLAGLKVAAYIGEAARELVPDEIATYETRPYLEQAAQYPDLPKVGYIHMLQSQTFSMHPPIIKWWMPKVHPTSPCQRRSWTALS